MTEKFLLDLVAVHDRVLRQDPLQQQAQLGNVPLAVAEGVDRPALDVLAVHPEGQEERAARGDDAQILVEDQQRLADRVDDRLRQGAAVFDTAERVRIAHGMPPNSTRPRAYAAPPCWAESPVPTTFEEPRRLRGEEKERGRICPRAYRLSVRAGTTSHSHRALGSWTSSISIVGGNFGTNGDVVSDSPSFLHPARIGACRLRNNKKNKSWSTLRRVQNAGATRSAWPPSSRA